MSEENIRVIPVRHRSVIHLPPPSALSAGYPATVEDPGDPIEVPPEYLDLADEVKELLGYFADYGLKGTRAETALGRRVQRLQKILEAIG